MSESPKRPVSRESTPTISHPSTPIAGTSSTPNNLTLVEQEDTIQLKEPPSATLGLPSWITQPYMVVGTHLQVIYTGQCGSEMYTNRLIDVVVESRGRGLYCLVSSRNEQPLLHWNDVHPAPIVQPHQSQNLLLVIDGRFSGWHSRHVSYDSTTGLKLILIRASVVNGEVVEDIIHPEVIFDLPVEKVCACPLKPKANAAGNKQVETYRQRFRKEKGRG